jgi:hypothetical protein
MCSFFSKFEFLWNNVVSQITDMIIFNFSLLITEGNTSSLFSQQVVWAEQQFVKVRVKRDFIPPLDVSDVPTHATRRKRADLEVPSQRTERLFNDELWDQEWYLVSCMRIDFIPSGIHASTQFFEDVLSY